MEETTKTPKILFVEDDMSIAGLYKMRMELEGMDVVLCEDGEKALQEAKDQQPDLILLDIMLPKIDGFTLLQKYRQMPETKSTKIIIMSAIGEHAEVDRALKLGADDYIVKSQKPINEIMAQIKSMLERQTQEPESP